MRHKVSLAIVASWFLVATALAAHKSGELQFALIFLTVPFAGVFAASVFWLFREWRSHKWRSVFPLVLCILAVPTPSRVGAVAQHALFVWNKPAFERIVSRAEIQALPAGSDELLLALSKDEKRLTYFVSAERAMAGTLFVEIVTEGAFPVKHAGYVYTSSGAIDPNTSTAARWPYRRQVSEQWFRVAD